jgi:hypothetical protein
MKKTILLVVWFFFLANIAKAQVIENFEKAGSLGIFRNAKLGALADSIYQTADPSGKSSGALDVHFNLKGISDKNAISQATQVMSSYGAQQLTYWIYIPSNSSIPDSLAIGLWLQAAVGSWPVNELDYYAKDIPKGVWYPLSYPLTDSSIANPAKNDLASHQIGDFGIRWNNSHCVSASWSGDIYIDNVSLIGVKPAIYSDYKTSLESFSELWNNGWKDSIYQTTVPVGGVSGVLGFKLKNGSAKTAGAGVGIQPSSPYDATKQNFLAVWVYADETFPDSGYFQVFAQDNSTWNWPNPKGITTYDGRSVPKNVWYPLYFDLLQASEVDVAAGSEFNSQKYKLGKFGLQVDAPKSWTGTVYVDRMEFINGAGTLPSIWVAANFENSSYGLQGFAVPTGATGTLTRVLYNDSYVMEGDIDFSKAPHQFAALRNGISLMDTAGAYAASVTFSVYIPSDIPTGTNIQFVLAGDAAINSAQIQSDNIVGSKIVAGQWNTITMNTDSLVRSGLVDPTKSAQVGVVIPEPGNSTWAGKLYFDNLTFYGITQSGQLTAVAKSNNSLLPTDYKLYNNYPNPFNPETTIRYDLPKESNVVIKVYDITGKEVTTLVNENKKAGVYSLRFNGSNFASGIYFYRITAGYFTKANKMIILK